jgi:hypothetical protein
MSLVDFFTTRCARDAEMLFVVGRLLWVEKSSMPKAGGLEQQDSTQV